MGEDLWRRGDGKRVEEAEVVGGRVGGSIDGLASSGDAWWGVSSRVGAVWVLFWGESGRRFIYGS